MEFGGLVVDHELLLGKPDLIGWVKVNLGFEEIEKGVKNREKHPNDAVAVAFAPASEEELLRYIASTDSNYFCPPAYAGLILYGLMHFGGLWQQDLLNQLPNKN